MRILVLNGSPNNGGGTQAMIGAFTKGAKTAGHEIVTVDVARMDIHGCLGCEHCHREGRGTCIQNDDMKKVYPLWEQADVIVLASPIYYGSLSGQLHCTLQRTYASQRKIRNHRKMMLFVCTSQHDPQASTQLMYHGFIRGHYSAEDCGVFEATPSEARSENIKRKLELLGQSI